MSATRIGRLPDADVRDCQAKLSVNCKHGPHRATYHVEVVDEDTGEVWARDLCTPTMGAWALKRRVQIPFGTWGEQTKPTTTTGASAARKTT